MQQTNVTRGGEDARAPEQPALLPPVDVFEDAEGLTLYADLPGVAKEKLRVEVEGDTLTIEGDIDTQLYQGVQPVHVEVNQPRFRRVFTLSRELDAEKLTAKLEQGVLKLHIGKAEHARARRITVQAA